MEKSRNFVTTAIKAYQYVSRYLPRRCRFYPTCSDYARQAFESAGFWRGCHLSLSRIARCHPWHPGGYDPLVISR